MTAKTRERQGRYQPDWNPNYDFRRGPCPNCGRVRIIEGKCDE